MKTKKFWIPIAVFAFLIIVILTLRTFTPEDGWICVDNNWQKHGQPNSPQPLEGCPTATYIGDREVLLYFLDEQLGNDCQKVTSTKITLIDDGKLYAQVLQQLISGPKPGGMTSAIATSTKILGIRVEDNKLFINLSKDIEQGGSCRVAAIRSQIETTMKQFPEIKTIEIAVEGNVSEALQP